MNSEKEVRSTSLLLGKWKSLWTIMKIFIFSWAISGIGIILFNVFRIPIESKASVTGVLLLPATLVLGPILFYSSDYRQERLASFIWLYSLVLTIALVLTAIGLFLHKKRLGQILATIGFLIWFFLGYLAFTGGHG